MKKVLFFLIFLPFTVICSAQSRYTFGAIPLSYLNPDRHVAVEYGILNKEKNTAIHGTLSNIMYTDTYSLMMNSTNVWRLTNRMQGGFVVDAMYSKYHKASKIYFGAFAQLKYAYCCFDNPELKDTYYLTDNRLSKTRYAAAGTATYIGDFLKHNAYFKYTFGLGIMYKQHHKNGTAVRAIENNSFLFTESHSGAMLFVLNRISVGWYIK